MAKHVTINDPELGRRVIRVGSDDEEHVKWVIGALHPQAKIAKIEDAPKDIPVPSRLADAKVIADVEAERAKKKSE